MPFISITRLKVRAIRFLPGFAIDAIRTNRQVKRASGFQRGSLLMDRDWTFWTMTAWDDQQSMLNYIRTGNHKAAMPHLAEWCDEASVVHWEQAEQSLPSWTEADRRMRQEGRPSRVQNPSSRHAALTYQVPRISAAMPLNTRTAASK